MDLRGIQETRNPGSQKFPALPDELTAHRERTCSMSPLCADVPRIARGPQPEPLIAMPGQAPLAPGAAPDGQV
ncbi:MAG: hypothetical protein M0Z39_04115, partial [Actinomycetota bacterium]|nr:hypothetical protein [Actinomycetota bacterium]